MEDVEPRVGKTYHIALEGNIGAGKSTLLESFNAFCMVGRFVYVPLLEPIHEWTKPVFYGKSILELYYKDRKRWAFTFQMMVLDTLLKTKEEAVKEARIKFGPHLDIILISERSILTTYHCFARMLLEDGDMSRFEHTLYTDFYRRFTEKSKVDGIIYLKIASKTALERIKTRGRPGEQELDVPFLNRLESLHDEWIEKTELPVVIEYHPTHNALVLHAKNIVEGIENTIWRNYIFQ